MSLTELDQAEVSRLLELVISAADPPVELLNHIAELQQQPALAASLFESAAPLVQVEHYWTYYRMSEIYFALGRDDACFFTAAAAEQMAPDQPNWHMLRHMYLYFKARGRHRDAAAVLSKQLAKNPENPLTHAIEIRQVFRDAGLNEDGSAGAGAAESEPASLPHVVSVAPASVFRRGRIGRFGPQGDQSTGYSIDRVPAEFDRVAVAVTRVDEAEILVGRGNIIICDARGRVRTDVSLSQFPVLVERRLRQEIGDEAEAVDEVVVVSDKFPPVANLCHFLLDQMTRLALYQKAGVDTAAALALGPDITTPFQAAITAKLDVGAYRGVQGSYRLKAGRVWVASNCDSHLLHPAHMGAPWATDFLRRSFGATGEPGTRRLYISRLDAVNRHIQNEAEVATVLNQAGFETILASQIDYAEQVELFKSASHVVGLHGAGLANLVYCSPSTQVLEIFSPLGGTEAYAILSSALGLNYSVLIGSDAESTDGVYNDATMAGDEKLGMGGRQAAIDRAIIADVSELRRWLRQAGA